MFSRAPGTLRLAVRVLQRRPLFALVAVASLAIAIGVNATIFGLVDAVLVRPLPGERDTPLFSVFTSESDGNGFGVTSYPAAMDLAAHKDLFTHVGAWNVTPLQLTQGDRTERLLGSMVSGGWFGTLGAHAALGRLITPADDAVDGASPVIVLSDGLWRRRFAADPRVVGSEMRLNGRAWTVVGVLPPSFRGVLLGISPDVFVPARMEVWATPGRHELDNRGGRSFWVLGRLVPGLDLRQAQHRLDALAAELARRYPASDSGRAFLVTREESSRPLPGMHAPVALFMTLLQFITGLVLVIACVNLAGLLLARGEERRRELGVRLALGATRGQLVRMLVAESLLLGALGGLAGLALATLGARLLAAVPLPIPVPVTLDLTPDARVAGVAMALGLAAAAIFSFVPAWQTVSPSLTGPLRDADGYRKSRLRGLLVVTQVALSLLLLVGAGLTLRALARARALDPGFDANGVTSVAFDPSLNQYDVPRMTAFYQRLLEEVGALPGVQAAGIVENVPLGLSWSETAMWFPSGRWNTAERPMDIPVNAVSEGYFAALRIPIMRGRALRAGQATGEIVVNETFARRYFPNEEPIGQRVSFEGSQGPWRVVVGVARDSRYQSVAESPRPFAYLAWDHDGDDDYTLLVRSAQPPAALGPALRTLVRRIAPDMAPAQPEPLVAQLGAALLPGRLASGVLAVAGSVALLLASMGLYAVVAFGVQRRTKEIGVRVALGALPRDILRLVMGEGSRLLGWGLAIGLALSLAGSVALRGLLYGLSPLDLPAYAGVFAVLAITASIACWLPARRATAVDPVIALRHE